MMVRVREEKTRVRRRKSVRTTSLINLTTSPSSAQTTAETLDIIRYIIFYLEVNLVNLLTKLK